jgi:hypothetical protein
MSAGGVVIISDDTEALDRFETLFRSLAQTTLSAPPTYNVFYLRY